MNFDKINITFNIQNNIFEDGTLVYERSVGNLNLEQQFDAGFTMATQMSLASVNKVMNGAKLEGEETFFTLLQSDSPPFNLNFDIRDRGFLGNAIAIHAGGQEQSADAARANIRATLDQAVFGALPYEGARLAVGIDHFLRQG